MEISLESMNALIDAVGLEEVMSLLEKSLARAVASRNYTKVKEIAQLQIELTASSGSAGLVPKGQESAAAKSIFPDTRGYLASKLGTFDDASALRFEIESWIVSNHKSELPSEFQVADLKSAVAKYLRLNGLAVIADDKVIIGDSAKKDVVTALALAISKRLVSRSLARPTKTGYVFIEKPVFARAKLAFDHYTRDPGFYKRFREDLTNRCVKSGCKTRKDVQSVVIAMSQEPAYRVVGEIMKQGVLIGGKTQVEFVHSISDVVRKQLPSAYIARFEAVNSTPLLSFTA